MAFDLITGTVLISLLSVSACHLAPRLERIAGRAQPLLFPLALLATLMFAWLLSGKLGWAALVPSAAVIFWANPMPLLLAGTAGLAQGALGLGGWGRRATVTSLVLLAIGYIALPVARPLFAPAETIASSGDPWEVCLQSHRATCAPAAAATLLRMHGIAADETGLVDQCLTSRSGTQPLHLFRGLALASHPHPFRPRVASALPQDWVAEGQLPNIALVCFPQAERQDSLRRLLGPQLFGLRGEGHAVVVIGQDHRGNWIVADPAIGKTIWSQQEFRERFTGDAIFLDHCPSPLQLVSRPSQHR